MNYFAFFICGKNKKNCAKNAHSPVFFITLHVSLILAICRQGCRAPLALTVPDTRGRLERSKSGRPKRAKTRGQKGPNRLGNIAFCFGFRILRLEAFKGRKFRRRLRRTEISVWSDFFASLVFMKRLMWLDYQIWDIRLKI